MRLPMKLKDIFQIIEQEYPISLSHQFASSLGMSDNSGMLINFDDSIKEVIFALDLSTAVVEKAIAIGANCIITHHPVIFKPIKSLSMQESTAPLLKAIANKINIISMHLNADVAQNGIDSLVAQGLGLKNLKATEYKIVENCMYGRVFEIEQKTLKSFVEEIKDNFKSNKVWLFGKEDREIQVVASFCGAGIDSSSIAFVQKNNVDVVVSSDIKHNILLELIEKNIAVVQMTHYANENFGFYKIYENLSKKLGCKCHYSLEEILL